MTRKFTLFTILATTVAFSATAGVKVTSLDLKTEGENGSVGIALQGRSSELPDLKVYGNTIEISLSGAEPFAAIAKEVRGSRLTANVLNGKAVVKAVLPYPVDKDGVSVSWKNSNLEVLFPRGKAPVAAVTKPAPVAKATPAPAATPAKVAAPAPTPAPKPSTVKKDSLNEDYLNKLMGENEQTKGKTAAKDEFAKDEVSSKLAAPVATQVKKEEFSFAGYAAKFTGFLAVVLGLFYGIVQLLKKGVFNRGKLGFLNNHQMIEVLSTTYVSPKKSLMIVKAHKQLFLVANSENGIQFLAEMKDTSGIIKEGEKAVTGENFDLNLADLVNNAEAPAFKLKEDMTQSTPVPEEGLVKIAKARDIVKFSDELKKKAKKLRPIEFN